MYTPQPWVVDLNKSADKFDIFNRLSNYTPNSSWKNIFIDLSNGLLPKYFKYDGDYLIYSRGEKVKTLAINCKLILEKEEEKREAVFAIMKFMEECSNLVIKDSEEELNRINAWAINSLPERWADIRRQNVKEKYIAEFSSDFAKNVGITSKSAKYRIYESFICAICNGWIPPTDIYFDGGKIMHIENVVYDPVAKDIVIDYSRKKSKSLSIKKQVKETIVEKKWNKYVTSLKNKLSGLKPRSRKTLVQTTSYATTGV